ncbi:adenylyl cyclase [Roseivirga sp. BDSF3-8]|uniref:adenylyl cyclase n=1 Tax=Roseivirga sp. BDSF3-8 TaxID=3241598 RepID=UPI003531CF02
MKPAFFPLILVCLLAFAACTETANTSPAPPVESTSFDPAAFGENVLVFDTTMQMATIQHTLDSIFKPLSTREGHFSDLRYALMFKPGRYQLDIQVGYFMHIIGLGTSPRDVVIEGAVRSNSFRESGNVLINFWRAVENLTIQPTGSDNTNTWGVSQAAPMRRVHVKGNLRIHDGHYASGGFIADSKVEGTIDAGGGQQWYTRNSHMKNWTGGNWNVFFQGVPEAPAENWPESPVTTIATTDRIREKPYLVFENGTYLVRLPRLRDNATGTSWDQQDSTITMDAFHVAQPEKDNARTINKALQQGKHLLLTPGIYEVDEPIRIDSPGTIVLGIGLANLVATNGNSALEVADVDGVTIAGLLVDAGPKPSPLLIRIGEEGADTSHMHNPTFLFDVFVRVGGPFAGAAEKCLVINSSDVIIDHTWLWRADHGEGVGWDINRSDNGLVVNGDDVIAYGLFCEHFQQYQTLWSGEGGKVYFFQCEMPYDPPTIESWGHNGIHGYAAYKVADSVQTHQAYGVGIYNVFYDAHVIVDQAIECPPHIEDDFHHIITFWLNGMEESEVRSIINGKGAAVNINNRKATL